MHQSSHPSLLTSHIRVAKRKAITASTEVRANIDVARIPPDLSALPTGGGVVGFCIFGTWDLGIQGRKRRKVGEGLGTYALLRKPFITYFVRERILAMRPNSMM